MDSAYQYAELVYIYGENVETYDEDVRIPFYECKVCFALVAAARFPQHFSWHRIPR